MSTKAFEVKRALKGILDESPALAKAQVTYGHPTSEPERRAIHVLKVEWERSEWKTNRSREEEFDVNVRCLVFVLGGSSQDAETEVETLTREFEDALRAHPDLGVAGVLNTDCFPSELDSAPADNGWVAGIDYKVRVTARI